MRPLRAAATALVAVLALSSCDGGSDPADPSPTAQPSSSSSEPGTTPPTEKPVEPVLPAAATKATEAGARAFITYYWDLINYAQLTGDVRPLRAVSGSSCEGCAKGIAAVNEVYDAGGHTLGGEYTASIDRLKNVKTKSGSLYGFEVQLRVRNAEQTIVHGDGRTEVMAPETTRFLIYLIWTDDAWRTDVLEPQ